MAPRNDVLLVTPDLLGGIGGIARIARATALACHHAARAAGGQLQVLALNDSGDLRDPRYLPEGTIYQGFGGSRWRLTAAAVRRAWRDDFGVAVFCHVNLAVIAGLFPPSRRRTAIVAHGIEVWERLSLARRRTLRSATEVWPVSRYTGEVVELVHGVNPERVRVIHNCLDPAWQASSEDASSCRAEPPYGLLVSRMELGDAYKGVEGTLQAFAKLRSQRPELALQLHLVGDGADRARLEAVARTLGLEEHVSFMGAVSDEHLSQEYQRCAFFVLPSRKEGFGLVYLEAMAARKAVIAARATAVPEIVRHGESGELVPYGDVDALAASMERLCADRDLADRYGARGRLIVESEFTFERYRRSIETALRERFLG